MLFLQTFNWNLLTKLLNSNHLEMQFDNNIYADKLNNTKHQTKDQDEEEYQDEDDNATQQEEDEIKDIPDPMIKFNRKMYKLNTKLDNVILKPTAKIYGIVTTQNFREAIQNALDNYKSPASSVNSILQKDGKSAALHFWRFIINSSLGCFGLVDIASKIGLEKPLHKNFGSTLAYFGMGPVVYIMLPIFGPTNLRDMWDLLFFNAKLNYANKFLPQESQYFISGINVIHYRNVLLPFDNTIKNIPDSYNFIKKITNEKREKEIKLYKK